MLYIHVWAHKLTVTAPLVPAPEHCSDAAVVGVTAAGHTALSVALFQQGTVCSGHTGWWLSVISGCCSDFSCAWRSCSSQPRHWTCEFHLINSVSQHAAHLKLTFLLFFFFFLKWAITKNEHPQVSEINNLGVNVADMHSCRLSVCLFLTCEKPLVSDANTVRTPWSFVEDMWTLTPVTATVSNFVSMTSSAKKTYQLTDEQKL